ncbi:MAG: glycosyltransferase family 2 protein [Arenicellales bacterium]|nr:glycosyltransferase family 2 protein [Arenicellales bacterium]
METPTVNPLGEQSGADSRTDTATAAKRELLSIVIPVYKSALSLEETVRKTMAELDKLDVDYEIILIDDGSPDLSRSVADLCAKKYAPVKAINLIRNYGQHTAIFCGIEHASGDYVVTMDDDLQNPPEEVGKLLAKIREGYDLVFAEFESKKHAPYRKLGTKIIDYLNKKIFDKPDDVVLTNFRIFTKAVAKRVSKYQGHEPYIPGLLLMSATRVANTLTRHASRSAGQSNYTTRAIVKLVGRLLFNYSPYPLRFLSLTGGTIAFVSFSWALFSIMRKVVVGTEVEGWTTLVSLLSFLNGFIILMMGVLGEYVVRLVNTVSSDRAYHVAKDVEQSNSE